MKEYIIITTKGNTGECITKTVSCASREEACGRAVAMTPTDWVGNFSTTVLPKNEAYDMFQKVKYAYIC